MKSFKFFSVPEHHITKFDVEPITVIGQTWHDARNISFEAQRNDLEHRIGLGSPC